MNIIQQEALLLDALKKGDANAFRNIYESYRCQVQFMAYYILRDQDEAIDVVQEVFKDLWIHRENINITNSLLNYLIRAGKNKSLNLLKSRSRYDRYATSTDNIAIIQSPGQQLENKDILKLINSALNNIESNFMRDAFTLVHIEGLNYKETAQQLGISIQTSRTYVYKVTKQLRILLKNFRCL